MSDYSTFTLLSEKAKDNEHRTKLALNVAQIELENFHVQIKQIETYRLEYCQQLMNRGKQGLNANEYGHLNRFLVQLDETLAKQKRAESHFVKNVNDSNDAWLNARKYRKSIEWLLEKKQKEIKIKEAKQEQKLMDEFASLAVIKREQH